IDGHWTLSLQLGQNGKLCGAQSGRREKLVIGCGHVARRLAHREAHAVPDFGWTFGAHGIFAPLDEMRICSYIGACTPIVKQAPRIFLMTINTLADGRAFPHDGEMPERAPPHAPSTRHARIWGWGWTRRYDGLFSEPGPLSQRLSYLDFIIATPG